jgi:hypothetical protein
MTHDRVTRFVNVFDSFEEAAGFAREQALAWLERAGTDSSPPPKIKE